MRHTQWLSSSALLFLGLAVMTATLRASHVRASYAFVGSIDRSVEGEVGWQRFTAPDMPGSVPYFWTRGWERAEMLWLTEDEKPEVWIARIGARRESAEMAAVAGRDEIAFSTYLKSFGYLHQAAHACFAQSAESVACQRLAFTLAADQLVESLRQFSGQSSNDELHARADGLASQIQSLRQQFQF